MHALLLFHNAWYDQSTHLVHFQLSTDLSARRIEDPRGRAAAPLSPHFGVYAAQQHAHHAATT